MHVFEPSRSNYRKKITDKKDSCLFCSKKIIKEQNCTKFSFKYWWVLANKHPYMNGNVMLVPKKHHETLETINQDEWGEFSEALLEVKKVLQKMFKTESFNIGINIGEESGASIAHLHWQIIPRKRKNYTVVSTWRIFK